MISRNPRVELHPAFYWLCDECGGDNYVRLFTPVLDDDELAELTELFDADCPGEVLEGLAVLPGEVECVHCHSSYDDVFIIGHEGDDGQDD